MKILRPQVYSKALSLGGLVLLWGGVAGMSGDQPAGAPPPEATLLKTAWRNTRLEEFDLAEQGFNTVLRALDTQSAAEHAAPPALQLRANALYGLGLVSSLGHHGKNPAATQRRLRAVIDLVPHSELAAWAALALAREAYLPVNTDAPEVRAEVQKCYAQVVADYPQSVAAQEAFVYLQASHIQALEAGQLRQSLRAIDTYLQEHPQARFRSALHTLQSKAYSRLQEYPQSLAAAIKALETREIDPTNPWQNNVADYFQIALMAQYDVGDFVTARRYYNQFLKEYPQDQRAFTVQMQLQRMQQTEAQLRAETPPPRRGTTNAAGAQGARP